MGLGTEERLIAGHPTIVQNSLRLLALWLQEARERLEDLGVRHATQRVARALLRSVRPAQWRARDQHPITLTLSHQDLADIVGASLYTVSRVLSDWKRAGIVGVRRGRVIVYRAENLVAFAEGISLGEAMRTGWWHELDDTNPDNTGIKP